MSLALELRGHLGCINTCSFNPYGDLALTGCDDGSVWLWDVGNRCRLPKLRFRPHHTNVFVTKFLSGNRFISGGNDATVQLIEIHPDGSAFRTEYRNHHIRKVHGSFVIDSNTFATCSFDSTVRLFDIRTPYRNQTTDPIDFLASADYEDEDARLIVDLREFGIRSQASGGGLIRAVDESEIDNGSLLLDLRSEPDADLFQMDVHPIDRKRFLTSGMDGTVRLFDMRAIRSGSWPNSGFSFTQKYRGEQPEITGAAFDETGDRIAATVIGGAIHILDANQFTDLTPAHEGPRVIPGEIRELRGHHSGMTLKSVNWFGNFVITGTDEGDVFFYDASDGELVEVLSGHQQPVNVVTVHPEKRLIATSGVDHFAIIWEPRAIAGKDVEKEIRAAREIRERNDQYPRMDACVVM